MFVFSVFFQELKKHKCRDLVRVCEPSYQTTPLEREGVEVKVSESGFVSICLTFIFSLVWVSGLERIGNGDLERKGIDDLNRTLLHVRGESL